MIRLVQLCDNAGERRVALAGEAAGLLRLIDGYARVYDLALAAIRADALQKVDGQPWRLYAISIYRCLSCGYLESYAYLP